MITNQEIRIYPEWFDDKAKKGLDDIRDYLRAGHYPVSALVIEKDAFFIQAEVSELTDEMFDAAAAYDNGCHSIMFDFVPSNKIFPGEVFHV